MLHYVVNGFTIVTAQRDRLDGGWWTILGVRRHPDGWEYVVARMRNLEDDHWASGEYTRHFKTATDKYNGYTY